MTNMGLKQLIGRQQPTSNQEAAARHSILRLRGFNEKLKSLEVEVRSRFKTKLGQIAEIVNVSDWGLCLRLNGDLMAIEKNENCLHQSMVRLGSGNLDQQPEFITILGGGDGGVLKHCLRLNPKSITQLELDSEIVDICKQHLPHISEGAFDDPRVKTIWGDAFINIEGIDSDSQNMVLVDMTDGGALNENNMVFGPRENHLLLNIKRILSDGGTVVCQASEKPQDVLEIFKKYFNKSYGWVDSFNLPNANCYVYSIK